MDSTGALPLSVEPVCVGRVSSSLGAIRAFSRAAYLLGHVPFPRSGGIKRREAEKRTARNFQREISLRWRKGKLLAIHRCWKRRENQFTGRASSVTTYFIKGEIGRERYRFITLNYHHKRNGTISYFPSLLFRTILIHDALHCNV